MDEDKNLLMGIISKDESSMESFYRKYASLVYNFSLRTVSNPADAAEVLNEVMLEVWRKAESFASKSTVKTWLLSITHHKAVDLLRKSLRHEHEDEEAIQHSEQVNDFDLQKISESSEDKHHVKVCISELSASHRHVVYLTFFEGLSYPEIANVLSVPAGTVKTRMMHAKKQLLLCLSRFVSR
jgi:RNA polymerase sigma-70 factor (ECF subfamily)